MDSFICMLLHVCFGVVKTCCIVYFVSREQIKYLTILFVEFAITCKNFFSNVWN